MIKIFTNVWPNQYTKVTQEFSVEYINKLIDNTDIETTMAFDTNDPISLILLDQADEMQEFMLMHNLNGRVGIIYNLSYAYPGWTLIIKTDTTRDSINMLVSKFFRWDRIESQSVLSFDEILEIQ